jgi:hypothetical protein
VTSIYNPRRSPSFDFRSLPVFWYVAALLCRKQYSLPLTSN